MRLMTGWLVLLSTAFLATTFTVCGQGDSHITADDLRLLLADVRGELESNAAQPKQAPFAPRSFRPFMEDEWIGNAVSYGPYRRGQAPGTAGPSEEEIFEDLTIITRYWSLIRIYGADDDAERILKVIDGNDLPVRVMLGVWLEPEESNAERRSDNITQVLRGIELANLYPDIVIAVNVGNETQVFWSAHKMNPTTLVHYIRALRKNVSAPVTTADDYNFWNKPESGVVAGEVDFIVTHIYPLWNGKTLDEAIVWMDQMYREIQGMHSDKVVVIGETGWATDYNAGKTGPGQQGTLVKGEVGLEAQAAYLVQHNEWVDTNRITCFLFEVFDEPWKGGGESSPANEIEKHWGVFYEDRTPKPSFIEYLSLSGKSER
ncbi:glycosyl hydrolase family 17 [bacterium]|nr:glycosyl hydrolase family 17 [bacterium]